MQLKMTLFSGCQDFDYYYLFIFRKYSHNQDHKIVFCLTNSELLNFYFVLYLLY